MEDQTIDAQPFKVSLKVAVITLIGLGTIGYTGVEMHSKDIARIARLEAKNQRLEENNTQLLDRLLDLRSTVNQNSEDIDDINIQYAKIETRLSEIALGIKELKSRQ